jgi:dipeptidase E
LLKIVALGGGSIGFGAAKPEVLPISREIVRFSGKKNPRLTFLPTASSDDRAYVRAVESHFGRQLGCRVSTLYLLSHPPSFSQIRKTIWASDIIYVGGGNTLMMMNRWKRLGLDRIMHESRGSGKVFCGTSAGAICWFRQGNSDSRKYKNPKAKLIKVNGLGWVEALFCPHYDVEKGRKPELREMMRHTPGVALAATNCAALQVAGDQYRLLTSKPSAGVYKVYWSTGKYFKEKLETGGGWKNLRNLVSKS